MTDAQKSETFCTMGFKAFHRTFLLLAKPPGPISLQCLSLTLYASSVGLSYINLLHHILQISFLEKKVYKGDLWSVQYSYIASAKRYLR